MHGGGGIVFEKRLHIASAAAEELAPSSEALQLLGVLLKELALRLKEVKEGPLSRLPVNDAAHEEAHDAPRLPVGSVGAQMTAPGRRRMPGGGGSACSRAALASSPRMPPRGIHSRDSPPRHSGTASMDIVCRRALCAARTSWKTRMVSSSQLGATRRAIDQTAQKCGGGRTTKRCLTRYG